MTLTRSLRLPPAVLFLALASVANAQSNTGPAPQPATPPDSLAPATAAISLLRTIEIQHIRPADQRGLNVFESPKSDKVPFKGFALSFGGAFVQDFQNITHSNTADAKLVSGVNANQLMAISPGFNNSVANLYINAQLADGIRVAMTSYLSARHHNETWVKDGYLSIDKSPIDIPLLNNVMKYVTLRVGQFEVNYGDQHFRRTDNGGAMFNPFVGNLIVDAMTTEVGGELTFRSNGFIAMAGATGGESQGTVTNPQKRTAAYLGKLGWDGNVPSIFGGDMRVRVTGSMYTISKAASNVLYTGDRGGSRYYYIMENTAATSTAQAWSGNLQPGFGHNVAAYVVNPFVKCHGFEFFGNFETASGHSWTETTNRTWRQNAVEALYRLGPDEKFYIGGRYNTADGQLQGIANDVGVTRTQLGAGWYLTPNVLLKLENVLQQYKKFPTSDIRNGGKFGGLMFEGVVSF